jgi:hypothetical protein
MSFIVSYETVDSSTECEHECATYNAAQAFVASLDGLLSWHTISNEHGEIDPDHYCIKHNCTTGEGDICGQCEAEFIAPTITEFAAASTTDMYTPSPEEYAQAMQEADTMNFNMRTYGTIDVPANKAPVLNVSPEVNDLFIRYFTKARYGVSSRHTCSLPVLVRSTWQLGKDQAIIECMIYGYSLCVAVAEVQRIHDQMDREYADWLAELEAAQPGYIPF